MIIKVPIGVSARHVHLTKETYNKLFDSDLSYRNSLTQPNQFASNEIVTLKGNTEEIKKARVLGPLRSYDQVEISKSDARILGLNPPVRRSGDLLGAEEITLITPKRSVKVNACIIPNRHLHINEKYAKELGLKDNDIVKLSINGIKSGVIDCFVKVSADATFEVHLDTDDANAFLINNGDEGTLIL